VLLFWKRYQSARNRVGDRENGDAGPVQASEALNSCRRFLLVGSSVALSLSISDCRVSERTGRAAGQTESAPADFPGVANSVPASPTTGQSRPGIAFSVYIQAAGTGDKVAFTVFEPSTLEGGKTYPLVLQASGFGLSRETPSTIANVKPLIDAGYGVISFDHRGHGESGGVARNMDPDYEGKDVLAVLDWAEAKLDWLKYRPSGGDPHNLVLGSIGGSYGGMYQYMLHNIDPKHRLDAMVPSVAPNDLTYSNFPGGVPKASYLSIRRPAGTGPSIDPYASSSSAASLMANKMVDGYADYLYYHSNQYFCADRRVATNGGPDTAPEHPPRKGPKVNALLFQGMRDTLFNFNEAYANYQCLRSEGGDVRLLSYQNGHNDVYVVPDPGEAYLPQGNVLDHRCGSLPIKTAIRAFFDRYLKDDTGGADSVPTKPCLSIAKDDAVLVNQVMTLQSGGATAVDVPATNVIAGMGLDQPVAIDLGIAGAQGSSVVAGIPHVQLKVHAAPDSIAEPILFVGLGQKHNAAPDAWDLIDNQVLPLRGTGAFDVDLVGVAARLAAGEKLALLVYGRQSLFVAPNRANVPDPAIVPVTISGKVWVPLLPAGSYQTAP
jgi:ABC-2 type transport system ATP-binding protein